MSLNDNAAKRKKGRKALQRCLSNDVFNLFVDDRALEIFTNKLALVYPKLANHTHNEKHWGMIKNITQ